VAVDDDQRRAADLGLELVEGFAEQLGVVGVADPDHGRVRRAELTAAGRRLLAKADAAVDSVEREMLAGLTGAERKALRDALGSAVRGLLDGA